MGLGIGKEEKSIINPGPKRAPAVVFFNANVLDARELTSVGGENWSPLGLGGERSSTHKQPHAVAVSGRVVDPQWLRNLGQAQYDATLPP